MPSGQSLELEARSQELEAEVRNAISKPHLSHPAVPGHRRGAHVFLWAQGAEGDGKRCLRGIGRACFHHGVRGGSAVYKLGSRKQSPAFRKSSLHLARYRYRPLELREARWHAGSVSSRCRIPARSAVKHLAVIRYRRGNADTHL